MIRHVTTSALLATALLAVACSGRPAAGPTAPVNDMAQPAPSVDSKDVSTAASEEPSEGSNHATPNAASSEQPAAAGGRRVIEVHLSEFAFQPDEIQLVPGEQVRFVLVNDGTLEHEFRLTNEHEVEEHLAEGHQGGHGEEVVDLPAVIVAAGESTVLDFDVPADVSHYTLIACLLPGHYENGMKGSITYRE